MTWCAGQQGTWSSTRRRGPKASLPVWFSTTPDKTVFKDPNNYFERVFETVLSYRLRSVFASCSHFRRRSSQVLSEVKMVLCF